MVPVVVELWGNWKDLERVPQLTFWGTLGSPGLSAHAPSTSGVVLTCPLAWRCPLPVFEMSQYFYMCSFQCLTVALLSSGVVEPKVPEATVSSPWGVTQPLNHCSILSPCHLGSAFSDQCQHSLCSPSLASGQPLSLPPGLSLSFIVCASCH